MKTIIIDRDELVKAISQLTHTGIDQAEWPWVVLFDPSADQSVADVRLPDRMSSQGGFHTLRHEDPDQPESVTGQPEPVMATPLDFVDLEEGFRWGGEISTAGESQNQDEMRQVADRIRQHLRRQVTIEGERYRVEYR